jgi:hypothetical protein
LSNNKIDKYYQKVKELYGKESTQDSIQNLLRIFTAFNKKKPNVFDSFIIPEIQNDENQKIR